MSSAGRHSRIEHAVLEDVRLLGTGLERSYPVYVHGRLKFRVNRLV